MVRVEFIMDDLVFEAVQNSKLVGVCRESGSSIPFGCTNGICGTCICKVVSGNEHLSEQTMQEKQTLEMFGAADGVHRLACQCRVLGDVKLDNP